MTKTVSILGAGIQGVCVALMLQKHGYKVNLIDKSWGIMNRASMTQEGKIHLGLIYGMDKSLRTGYRMVQDALHFAPILDRLLGANQNWDLLKSKKDTYLVTKDSMLSSKDAETYFEALDTKFQEQIRNTNLHYLGSRPERIFQKSQTPWYVESSLIDSAFQTEEVSVDQPKLKELFKRKIQNTPSIELFLEHKVMEIKRKKDSLVVVCKTESKTPKNFESEIVVNCMWENRIYFDQMMGIEDDQIHSLRLKYGLILKADDFLLSLDSVNLIHGAYGSFVIHPNSNTAFFCWYPSSMKGLIPYGPLPESWEQACDGNFSKEEIDSLIMDNFIAFKRYIPKLQNFNLLRVSAGVILAEGNKDIDKPDSGFHSRIESPIRKLDGYYSVSTSKFTSAPRNTLILEKELFPEKNSFLVSI